MVHVFVDDGGSVFVARWKFAHHGRFWSGSGLAMRYPGFGSVVLHRGDVRAACADQSSEGESGQKATVGVCRTCFVIVAVIATRHNRDSVQRAVRCSIYQMSEPSF